MHGGLPIVHVGLVSSTIRLAVCLSALFGSVPMSAIRFTSSKVEGAQTIDIQSSSTSMWGIDQRTMTIKFQQRWIIVGTELKISDLPILDRIQSECNRIYSRDANSLQDINKPCDH